MGTSLKDTVKLFEVCKNRRACGVSLWSERKTKSPLGAAAVAMKQKNQEVILGILVRSRRGACQELNNTIFPDYNHQLDRLT
jgi:hypothetical protein